MDYTTFFQNALTTIREDGRYRTFINIERCKGDFPHALYHTDAGSEKIIVWCGNDYLGMGQNEKITKAMKEVIDRTGSGAGGTRNISGTSHYHVELEKEIADLHDQEAALVFTSGYVANETTLQTLGATLPDCVVFSDSENHASMIQGIRNSRAEKHVFKHNDAKDLRQLMAKVDPERPKLIAIESIYSMGADIAPIEDFCELAEEFNALLFLDEVHGVGMYGHKGGGIAQLRGLSHRIDIIQGTLGKAFGLIGGYIAGKAELVDYVRSFSPGFIFTTSLPPTIMAGAVESIRHLKASNTERESHQANAVYLKKKLTQVNIPYLQSESHIVPVIVGDAVLCKQVADTLLNRYKIYVQPINYPTVPMGTERLRLTPSALHTFEMIDELVSALEEIWGNLSLKRAA